MPPTVARLAVEMSGAKRRPCGSQRGVQLVEHDARLDARPALGDVHLEEAVEVLRRVDRRARRRSPGRPATCRRRASSAGSGDVRPPRTARTRSSRGCVGRRRRAARSGRRWRRWSRARARPRRTGPRRRTRRTARARARRTMRWTRRGDCNAVAGNGEGVYKGPPEDGHYAPCAIDGYGWWSWEGCLRRRLALLVSRRCRCRPKPCSTVWRSQALDNELSGNAAKDHVYRLTQLHRVPASSGFHEAIEYVDRPRSRVRIERRPRGDLPG